MCAKTPPRCRLQVARERRLSVHPGRFGLEQDICDVSLWLATTFRQRRVHLWIDRHYTHEGRQIAHVRAMTWHKDPDRLTPHAQAAFLALGYEIHDTGADTYAHQHCDGRHSRHEALAACGRIEQALASWHERNGSGL